MGVGTAKMGVAWVPEKKVVGPKVSEMKNSLRRCTWVYNESGQCLSYSSVGKYPPGYWPANVHAGKRKANVAFFYNPDGTVSKVTSKSNDYPSVTVYYSYVKK